MCKRNAFRYRLIQEICLLNHQRMALLERVERRWWAHKTPIIEGMRLMRFWKLNNARYVLSLFHKVSS